MVFLCANTCVVHAPAAVIAHEKSRVLSFLEEVVDFSKLSAVQFVPRGLIRLTITGGERGLVVSPSPPPCHWMDLSSAAPNSTPAHFVNSQLVCLLPVGVFNEFLFIYDICFLIYSVPN